MFRFLFSKIGLSLIFAILIIGGGIYYKNAHSKPKSDIRAKIDLIAKESIQNAIETGQVDTQSWEEALKIANGSSTLDEKIADLQKISPEATKEEEDLTATEKFSRALFEKYVKFKNSGGTIDDNTTIRFVNELLTEDYGGPEGEKTYTATDITILDTKSAADLKKYGNLLGTALKQPVSPTYENEIVLINRVYETGDVTYLDKLPENIARYEQIRKIIVQIPVPVELVDAHIAILNSLSTIIDGVKGMVLIDTDPIGATNMILGYEDGIKSLDLSLRVVSSYFINNNINFSSLESGYLFLK